MAITSAHAQSLRGDTWASTKKNKKGTIVVTYTHTVYFSTVENGNRKGICFDIMNDFIDYVQERYGVSLNVRYETLSQPSNFKLFLNTMKASKGGVFGLGNMTITDDRKKIYDFSPPYFSNKSILVSSQNAPMLNDISEIGQAFDGFEAISQEASSHNKLFQNISKKHGPIAIKYVITSEEKMDMMLSGGNYYTYLDLPEYLDLIKKRISLKRQKVGGITGEKFGLILPKNNDWTPVLKEFFDRNGGYIYSLRYKEILSDNLGYRVLKLMETFSSQ